MEEEKAITIDKTITEKPKKNRIWEIDFLRGLCMFIMLFDHLMLFLSDVFGNAGGLWASSPAYAGSITESICQFAYNYWRLPERNYVQVVVAGMFVLLAGVSAGLSRNNIKRVLRLGCCAAIVTYESVVLSQYISYNILITFGVLHMLTVSMLALSLAEILLQKIKADEKFKYTSVIVFVLIGAALIAAGLPTALNWLPAGGSWLSGVFLYSYGFPSKDYFAILPWSGFMFVGAALGRLLYRDKKSLLGKYNESFCKYTAPIGFVGRKSIWFYMLQLPGYFMLLYLWGLIFGL